MTSNRSQPRRNRSASSGISASVVPSRCAAIAVACLLGMATLAACDRSPSGSSPSGGRVSSPAPAPRPGATGALGDSGTADTAESPATAVSQGLPAGLVTFGPLPAAPGLAAVLREARVGDRVTFAARIAGRADPFVPSRAVMIVSDPSLLPCNERPDDHCPTPADLCCESRETLLAATATVQVVDERGRLLPVTLAGIEGLAALDHVVIEGVLIERGDAGGFVVNASRMVRQPPS